jgi:hypothetical protein
MTRFNHARIAALLTLGLAAGLPAKARGQFFTWVGPGTDWNTAANWSPAGVPNSAGDIATFGGAALGTVNISSSVVMNQLVFSNSTGNYTLTSSAGQSLRIDAGFATDPPIIFVGAKVTGTETINLASVATGSLTCGRAGLTIVNNSAAAGTSLVIGPNTVIDTLGGQPIQGWAPLRSPVQVTLRSAIPTSFQLCNLASPDLEGHQCARQPEPCGPRGQIMFAPRLPAG